MRVRRLAVAALGMCLAAPVAADTNARDGRFIKPIPNHLLPGFVRFARVMADDRVTGNCWTDAPEAAARLTRRLVEGGIRMLDYEPADRTLAAPLFVISGMGYRFNHTLCVVSARLRVQSFAGRPSGGFDGQTYYVIRQPARLFEMNGVYVNSETANEAIAAFVL